MNTTSKRSTFAPGQRVRILSFAGGTEFTGLVGTIATEHPVTLGVYKVELPDAAPIWARSDELERANGD